MSVSSEHSSQRLLSARQRNAAQRTESRFVEERRSAGYPVTGPRAGEAADAFTGIPSIVRRSHGNSDDVTRRATHGGEFTAEYRRGESHQQARSRGAFSAAGVMLEVRFIRRERLSNAQ